MVNIRKSGETDEEQELDIPEEAGVIGYVYGKFEDAENGRFSDEKRWLDAYKNYRGSDNEEYRSSERSKVFVKVTKVKVLAAYGQIIDILFANKRFPISVTSTPKPEGIAEFAHLQNPQQQQQQPEIGPEGFAGDGMELLPGALEATMPEKPFLGGLSTKFGESENLVAGKATMNEPQIEPAAMAALNMEKVIQDQLVGSNAVNIFRHALFEACLLGTGVIKGPFSNTKTVHRWNGIGEGRTYAPYDKTMPSIEAVSCWDFYPDPSAVSVDDCEYVIQRHRFNRSQMRDLIDKPFFNKEAINECISKGPNYAERGYEGSLYGDEANDLRYRENRYEVLEFWGVLDKTMAGAAGIEIPKTNDHGDSVSVNLWVCNNMILRAMMNPFTPDRLPYQAVPYEINPYHLFGVGVAENMEDAQTLMNGHMRMAIDNLALAGNMVFDIDETSLVPGQSMEVFPGKIFRRQSGVTGTAVNGLKFPNTAPENLQMFQTARQLADEETGIPSITHGQTGVTGTGRTAAGLSMLLSSAGLSIKTVIKNIDDFMLKPMGEAFFQWNMQFNETQQDIIGDLEIKPQGSAAVMQKEVRTQRLTTLLQTVTNPMLAPFIKIPNLIRELAISQDIDPDQLVNDMNEAAVFADILRGLNERTTGEIATPNGQPPDMGASGGISQGAANTGDDQTGGGTIGVGTSPVAGESGFTANTGESEIGS